MAPGGLDRSVSTTSHDRQARQEHQLITRVLAFIQDYSSPVVGILDTVRSNPAHNQEIDVNTNVNDLHDWCASLWRMESKVPAGTIAHGFEETRAAIKEALSQNNFVVGEQCTRPVERSRSTVGEL